MTPTEIKARIQHIEAISADDEYAHVEEAKLRHEVLDAIAKGQCTRPRECAAEVLKSSAIEFSRWCA